MRYQYCRLQVDSAAGNQIDPYVIHITNDLYQPPQSVGTVVTNRPMQRTAGAAEAAAAKAAAAGIASAAAAAGFSAKAGVSSKVAVQPVTGLVGLHQVCVCLNI